MAFTFLPFFLVSVAIIAAAPKESAENCAPARDSWSAFLPTAPVAPGASHQPGQGPNGAPREVRSVGHHSNTAHDQDAASNARGEPVPTDVQEKREADEPRQGSQQDG